MYHVTNLGDEANRVRQYADLEGYIPQSGDRSEQFTWDGLAEWTADDWADHVANAETATIEAEAAIGEWQQSC